MNEPQPGFGQLPVQMDLAKSLRRTKALVLVAVALLAAIPIPYFVSDEWMLQDGAAILLGLASFIVSLVAMLSGRLAVQRARATSPPPELAPLVNWTVAATGMTTLGFIAAAWVAI